LAQGPETAAFEAECAEFVGRRHAVAVSSGTAALELALRALGIPPGASVYQSSYACAALATATRHAGGTVHLCDCRGDGQIEAAHIPPGAAAIAAHLFGDDGPVPAGPVVEDIAQSIGGSAGRAAPVAVASFYATKLLTTGEGGMVLTDDEAMAEQMRGERDYDGRDDAALRRNVKMTELQAAIGRAQLTKLPAFVVRRREIAQRYRMGLADLPLGLPPDAPGHVFFRFVVVTPQRAALEAFLAQRGIEAKRPVHCPAHLLAGHSFVLPPGGCPQAERAHAEFLSLPIYPTLDERAVSHVIDSVVEFFA
jgi:dTDP-4-amino-4,6-dideoxygalactose transaminase